MKTNRRSFLKTAGISSAPFILPSKIWAAETKPNDQIVMGFIGMGKQNKGLLGTFLQYAEVRVVAVCDVDTTRRENAQRVVNEHYTSKPELGSADCAAYNDFRELIARDDIDAVCIATPDHWHAIPTIAALQSGKDVYCEKPLTHNIHEAIAVIDAVKANRRVLQTGSMQRSMSEFRIACELVRNGIIGKVEHVDCSFGPPGVPCDLPEEPLEPGLDWDMWIGPGPVRPYNSVLSPRGLHDHFPNWRAYKEYGGGMVCDWGAHHIDIAQWGLGMDESGPVEVRPPDDPKATNGAVFLYDNGVTVHHVDGFGAEFFGSDGTVKVNRGQFELYIDGIKVAGFVNREDGTLGQALKIAEDEYLKDAKVKLYDSDNHLMDFLNCVKSRTRPITNEEVGGRTAICCHLMNQAYYNHATIQWKPKRMQLAPGSGKPEWLTREYRGEWKV
ncbi:MAG: Gfo/Idh/MocA family oxidoreductase [Candidatus Hydrogenedentes bacterium]|nr:Gfo/Idh/MocA family oxidoreductase [Candidatus Hydrogenedentota bacterium]